MTNAENEITSPLELAAKRHNINIDILVTSAFLRSLSQLGEVVLTTMPQSIVSNLARAAGAKVTYLINRELCEQHGLSFFEASKHAGVDAVCFDTKPIMVELAPKVQAGLKGLGTSPESISVTTPDNYLSSRVRVSWIALNDLSTSLLAVAKYTVQRHRPLLSGDVASGSISDIVAWCECNNYYAVTNTLKPLNSANMDTHCWLIPDIAILQSVESLVGNHESPINSDLPISMVAQQAWPALTEANDRLAHQTLDYLLNRRRWYYLDKLLNIGLFPMETDGENFWRWVGNDGVRLFLPLRASGHYTLSFDVFSLAEGLENTTLRCFVNGRLKTTISVIAGTTVKIPYYSESDGSIAEMLIVSELSVPIDDKSLSISISELSVYWEEIPL
ncbi:hypothetical protein Q4561_12575 [Alteromonas sp. 1_MG-2023]|uniref:hypothetical protein n=1 Tax=Alteromonas sp. 1_MG-2023 TaxID=3062669 RepID=UPI0026E1531F|nr:hypothetical protein [Alteromonas sp. 1_MG-2023]MDO6567898.1 hypothetical protein [Alteromonas sp. 1_MG-2023]